MFAAASSVHTLRWANAFADRGHQVTLVSLHEPLAGLSPKVKVHQLPYDRGTGYFRGRQEVQEIEQLFQPDVVNVHYASGYGTLAGKLRSPIVMNVWGSDVFEFPDRSFLHRALLKKNIAKADHIVSTSHFMARRTQQFLRLGQPLTVIPFGVETDRFKPVTKDEKIPVVGTVKTLSPKYGIDTLIQAFALLRKLYPQEVKLRIIGDGPQRKELEELVISLGIEDHVQMPGVISHDLVPSELARMDIFAALSRADSETFGVAVIEASSCGLPVVVSAAGGLPEVVKNRVTGHVVPIEDPVAAAKVLQQLLIDMDLRDRLGDAGRKHVIENYSWPDCVDRMMDVFGSVTKDRAR